MFAVRDGVALGLDQGPNGEAWGYDVGLQRVRWTTPGLPWPHYFVDIGGIGGSAELGGAAVIVADCAKLAPAPPGPPGSSSPPGSGAAAPGGSATPSAGSATPSAGSATPSATSGGPPGPSASASPSPSNSGQLCQRPELVAVDR